MGMGTEVVNLLQEDSYRDAVRRAGQVLADGGLVAFPTETVYGLGANAADPKALARLREVKERPSDKPFTLHIPRRSSIADYVPDLHGVGRRLVDKGWPGPLTLVFEVADASRAPVAAKLPGGDTSVLYHDGTIGVRCPDSSYSEDVLAAANVPIVAASANRAGGRAPISADEVMADLDGQVDLVLDGGTARYAKPSTIVRVSDAGYELLRPGVYDERMIRRLVTLNFLFVCTGNTCRSPMAAGICRKLMAERLGCQPAGLEERGYGVLSAGAFAFGGGPASEGAQAAMRTRGIDISSHRAQPLTIELIHQADFIFAMCGSHRDAVLNMAYDAESKTRLLDEQDEISDPVGGDDRVYEACAVRIEAAMRRRLEEISL